MAFLKCFEGRNFINKYLPECFPHSYQGYVDLIPFHTFSTLGPAAGLLWYAAACPVLPASALTSVTSAVLATVG